MIPDWLSWIDVAFAGVALLFAWGGFQKGFAGQVAHILTFVIMGVALFFAYPAIFEYFSRIFRSVSQIYLMWLILAGLLILAIGIFLLFTKLLARMLKTQISERSDAAYGLLLGLVRGLLVALFGMIFLVMLDSSGKNYDACRSKSYVGKLVCYELVPRIQPRLAPALERNIQELKDKLMEREEAGVLE
jgi:uncharacterized membrane protein required for colicin V production